MIASPPIETAVDWPSPAAVSVDDISVVMPPERLITPTGPVEYAWRALRAGPPIPPILITSGTMIPRQFGPMIRAPRSVGELDHLGDVGARDPLGHDDHEPDPVLERLEHGVLGERGRDGDDRAVDRRAVVRDRLGDGVEHRHAVDVAAEPARRHAADDLRAGAVVEALAREVDGLAPGDALDDERRLGVDQDAHRVRLHRAPRGLVERHASGPRRGRRSARGS